MKKRIVSLLMALVMAVSLLPTSVFATNETYTEDTDTALAVVEETQSAPMLLAAANATDTLQAYFGSLPITAETEPGSPNSSNKWKVTVLGDDQVLMSGNKGKNYASSTLQLTFTSDTPDILV